MWVEADNATWDGDGAEDREFEVYIGCGWRLIMLHGTGMELRIR